MCWTVESHHGFWGLFHTNGERDYIVTWARFFQNQKPYFPRIRLGFRCASMMALSEVGVSQNQVVIEIDI